MVVILKSNAEKQQVTALLKAVESLGLKTNYSEGQETTVVGLVGDTSHRAGGQKKRGNAFARRRI